MGWKGTRRVGGRQSNWLAYFEVYCIGFVFVTPQALAHQFSVDEGHVWLGWGIRSGGRICLIRSQQTVPTQARYLRPSRPFFQLSLPPSSPPAFVSRQPPTLVGQRVPFAARRCADAADHRYAPTPQLYRGSQGNGRGRLPSPKPCKAYCSSLCPCTAFLWLPMAQAVGVTPLPWTR